MNQNWTRIDLKMRAKEAFKKNYWAAVVVSLIVILVTAGGGVGNGRRTYTTVQDTYEEVVERDYFDYDLDDETEAFIDSLDAPAAWGLSLLITAFAIVVGLVVVLFKTFIGNALEVGGCKFYIENLYSNPKIGRIGYGFTSGFYLNVVKVMFLRGLFTFLWSLLFVIPGIIKAYEYYMVPYLLSEYPDMTWKEASQRSRDMMYGNKMETFILELSFLPWHLLSAITGGIVGLFYVNPYVDATKVELYDTLVSGTQNIYYEQY
ncbi:MAG: DUF975 family protein [Eubacteriales bacterium]|nr:DUF975 family protein [Eubacteriales bacterium]